MDFKFKGLAVGETVDSPEGDVASEGGPTVFWVTLAGVEGGKLFQQLVPKESSELVCGGNLVGDRLGGCSFGGLLDCRVLDDGKG